MYRRQKLGEDETSNTDDSKIKEKMEVEEMKMSKSVVEAASSSTTKPTEQVETCSKSPRPDVVSSTLNR